jgi:hypothetical protein
MNGKWIHRKKSLFDSVMDKIKIRIKEKAVYPCDFPSGQ